MLAIREAQMAVFAKLAFSRFEQRMVDHVYRFFPRQCEFIGKPQVTRAVQFAIERAQSRGCHSCQGICLYLSLAFLLGSFFDEDPQYPWAAHTLVHNGVADPDAKIARVYDQAMEYFDAVHGERNQHLIRALLRVRGVDPAALPAFTPGESLAAVDTFLSDYFPLKASRQPDAAGELLSHSIAAAETYNLTGKADAAILLLHTFLLGSGFDRDPQFPWVTEALAHSSSERGERMFRRSVEFLDAVLIEEENA
jgi:hypothetical protein